MTEEVSENVRQFTVQADDNDVRLDRWFKRHLPQVSFAMVSRWARTGQIRVDGKRADPADRLATGQVLRVPPGGATPERGLPQRKELTEDQMARADAMVIHRDRAAIVLNKEPGLATQGGSGTREHVDLLLDAFTVPLPGSEKTVPRPRLVHRLDKDTSGVLLIAATPGSAAFFSKRFSGRSARKIYWALVVGVPDIEDGLIDLPLAKQPGTGGEKMFVDQSDSGMPARTRYRVIDIAGNRAAWVELQPLTGRTHQLRVHMAAIGHPIVGDGKYGGPEAFLTGSISRKMHLHARRLIIEHPDGVPLDATAELPEHMANSMQQLGFDESEGEALDESLVPLAKEEKKAQAKAHAKQYRKERRGERRGRTGGERGAPSNTGSRSDTRSEPARKRGPTKGKGSPEPKAVAKPVAKPKTGAKPGPRSGTRSGPKPAPKPRTKKP